MQYSFVFAFSLLSTLAHGAVHTVDVGEHGLTIEPQTLTVAQGDTVIFHLYPRHNIVSGSFQSPCTPSDGGFFSGNFDQTDDGKKKFVVNVTGTDPVYYYCAVQRHCQSGMVGGWNIPSSGNTIQAYADAAKDVSSAQAPSSSQGGQLLEDEQLASLTASSGSSSATSSAASGSSAASSGASTTPAPSGSPSPSGSAPPSNSTGAADVTNPTQVGGLLGMALGLVAWLL